METMNDFELNNMRQQMETLKKKLEKQEIVNDRIIRQSMKKTASSISVRYYIIMALGLLMVPYMYFVFYELLELSLAFSIASGLLMLVCTAATYYNSLNLSNSNMMHGNLLDVRRRMARAKKFDANWLFFGIPAIIVWLGWLGYEFYQKDGETALAMIIGAVVGGVIGVIIGFSMHFKTQRQYQEIIDQIEEMEDMEDDQ
jgi:membrane associated rhomboid family serine protease